MEFALGGQGVATRAGGWDVLLVRATPSLSGLAPDLSSSGLMRRAAMSFCGGKTEMGAWSLFCTAHTPMLPMSLSIPRSV